MKMMRMALLLAIAMTMARTVCGIVLENDAMRLCFRDDCGMGLTGIVSKVGHEVRFAEDTNEEDLWRIFLVKPDEFDDNGNWPIVSLSNRSKTSRQYVTQDGEITTFAFEGMDLPDAAGAVDVYAKVEVLRGDGESRWTMDVVNRSAAYVLYKTHYPCLRKVGHPGVADVLEPSMNLGAKLVKGRGDADGTKRLKYDGYSYMGYWPMVAAFMQDGSGVYVAAHDPEGRIKQLVIDSQNSIRFSTVVENAGVPGEASSGPKYPVVVDVFRGDWWKAAKKYRNWALRQRWAEKGPIFWRADYPRAMCETPLWLNIHGDAALASNVLAMARMRFPDFNTGLHWHNWNRWGHDSHYPEYFPTVTNVAQVVPIVNKLGQKTMIYTNGRLWDAEIPSWEVARPSAATKPNGDQYIERYNNRRRQGVMCPYTGMWQDVMCGLADRITRELNAPALFMDQIGAAPASCCWNRTHGHALGGGSYWFEGYQKLLERAHAITSSRGAFLTTEGTAECWMNQVDGYLCVTFLSDEDVPFYPAVYSGYTTYFCSPQAFSDAPESFWAMQARQVLWGVAPGWFEPKYVLADDMPEVVEKREMIARLCRFRQQNLDCLAYGELLDELRFSEKVRNVSVMLNPRWTVKEPRPAILAGVIGAVWKSRFGRTMLFAANLTDAIQRVTVENDRFAGRQLEISPMSMVSISE